jgi:hypothetical protein
MKRKANDCTIDSGLISKRSANNLNPTPSNANLVLTRTNKITKTTTIKNSKNKEIFIKPIANNSLKKILDDENKKIKTLNNLNIKNLEIKDEILDMLIKKNLEMIDLEYCMKEYKDSLTLLEAIPKCYQESRITSNANIQYLNEQQEKANNLINNLLLKNSNLEMMIKMREEEIKMNEETVVIFNIVFRIYK